MLGLADPGLRIWLEPNDDPRKKLKHGWRLIDHGNGHFTGVDTALPNRALRAALMAREVPELAAYDQVQPEVRCGAHSRLDFRLTGAGLPEAWVEVKSVTLSRQPGLAEFPDSVTTRGARHLQVLADLARGGARAVMLFLIQRSDCDRFALARDIDPAYGAAFDAACAAGVETLCLDCDLSPAGVTLRRPVPMVG